MRVFSMLQPTLLSITLVGFTTDNAVRMITVIPGKLILMRYYGLA